jgi:hypothetical protein
MNERTLIQEIPAIGNAYRLRVQPVRLGPYRNFQVRIGMNGDTGLDYIPLHRSAFARLLQVEVAHAERSAAQLEAQMIAEFLSSRLEED